MRPFQAVPALRLVNRKTGQTEALILETVPFGNGIKLRVERKGRTYFIPFGAKEKALFQVQPLEVV